MYFHSGIIETAQSFPDEVNMQSIYALRLFETWVLLCFLKVLLMFLTFQSLIYVQNDV